MEFLSYPQLFLATAAMLRVGAQLVTPQPDKSLGEILLLSLADWFRVFVGNCFAAASNCSSN